MPSLLLSLTFLLLLASPVHALQSNPCAVAHEIESKAIALLDAKPDEAMKAFVNARSICPNDVAIGFNLGLAWYQTGQKKEAMAHWTQLLDAFPEHAKTQANLAWTQFELGDDKKALQLASNGFLKHPGNLAMAHTKIFALFRQGRYLEAYDWIMRMKTQEKEEKGTGLAGTRVNRWQEMATGFVVETLWRQFRNGERMESLRQAINLLVKEYPSEAIFVQTKDQLLHAYTDPDAEIPFSRPLPHEVWAKSGEIDTHNAVLDDLITTLPVLAPWQKRPDAFAVIAGVSHYKRIRARHFADRDATNMQRMLTRRGVFRDDADHTRLRVNGAADLQTLRQDLEWLVRQGQMNPNAMLLFYFSGLGVPHRTDGAGDALLLPADAQLQRLDPEHAISLAWLQGALSRLPNREVVVLLDVCFNNTPGCALRGDQPPVTVSRALLSDGKPMAVAAEHGEAAPHGPGQQGAFTWWLLKGMLGEADGVAPGARDGWVELTEALALAKDGLSRRDPPMDPIFSIPTQMRLTRTKGEQ
ncbi:MAG: caspase family protein [Magnetococcales bacterium]|nr:caspase family protein [Magnetococcales bacterium]